MFLTPGGDVLDKRGDGTPSIAAFGKQYASRYRLIGFETGSWVYVGPI
jgi:hypothetical protein